MNSLTEENYLKAIYKLLESTPEEPVTTNSIAAVVETKAASVTDMLKKLAKKKLIHYQKYQGVTLTKKGVKEAVYIIRKHRLWEVFLVEKLHFKWDEVHPIAEQLEHIHSYELVEKLDKFLEWPKFDPHGDPIPDVRGRFAPMNSFLLSEGETGRTFTFTGVANHSPVFLKYLDKKRISLGNSIKILERNEFDLSLQALVNGKIELFISSEVAKNMLVSVELKKKQTGNTK